MSDGAPVSSSSGGESEDEQSYYGYALNAVSVAQQSVAETASAGLTYAYSKWDQYGTKEIPQIETNLDVFTELFGPELVASTGALKPLAECIGEGKYVGIYVAAEWAAPCVPFTPALAHVYQKINTGPQGKIFEVVYVSADKDQAQFNGYTRTMPWLSVPFEKLPTRKRVMKLYKAAFMPKFVLLSPSGKMLTDDEKWVTIDVEGSKFPWEGSSDTCVVM